MGASAKVITIIDPLAAAKLIIKDKSAQESPKARLAYSMGKVLPKAWCAQ